MPQIPLVASRNVTTRHARACSNMANDEEAVVLACKSFVFCALNLHQYEIQLLENVKWTCSSQSTQWSRPWTRVVRVAPVALVVTSVSRRAVRQARHSTSRLFPVPKCMGFQRVVSWRYARSEFGLSNVWENSVNKKRNALLYRTIRSCLLIDCMRF